MKKYGQRDEVRLQGMTSSFIYYADLYVSCVVNFSVEHGHIQIRLSDMNSIIEQPTP